VTRIPITGIGVVAPGAIGVAAFRAQLAEGRSGIAVIDRFDTAGLTAHKAALLRDFNPREFISPGKMRRMNNLSRSGLSAARLAVQDSGNAALDQSTGVAIGTSFGPVQTSVEYMEEYVAKGASLAPPQLFAESVANAPGSHIAIDLDLRGFNITITQRESSVLAAAMYAASQIVKGAAPAALIGGVEEVNEMLFSVIDRIGALAHGDDENSRPFDRRRNGMVIGEGGAMFIAGGSAPPQAYFSGFGIARDITASVSDWGTGHEAVVRAMRAAVDDAGIATADVDAVYASANSTVRADRLEARAINALFGAQIPVVATKGIFGEYAAGGALQLAAAVLAIADQNLHPSVGFAERDEEIDIAVNGSLRKMALRHIVVNSVSAGGGIVSAVLSREPA